MTRRYRQQLKIASPCSMTTSSAKSKSIGRENGPEMRPRSVGHQVPSSKGMPTTNVARVHRGRELTVKCSARMFESRCDVCDACGDFHSRTESSLIVRCEYSVRRKIRGNMRMANWDLQLCSPERSPDAEIAFRPSLPLINIRTKSRRSENVESALVFQRSGLAAQFNN